MPAKPYEPSSEDAEAAIFAAELGDAPSVDLHGMDRPVAVRELEAFFHTHLARGTEAIKIIHGRGNQILRKAVMDWLYLPEQREFVAKFRDSQNPAEQGAVTYVALHRLK